jgi:small subunit ribosomal protein S21
MPTIEVSKCHGKVDLAMRRLKRICDRIGIQKDLREDRHIKPTTKRRRDKAAAIKRQSKSIFKEQKALAFIKQLRKSRHATKEPEATDE